MNTKLASEIWTITRTGQGNAVLLRPLSEELAIPIYIGQLEAQSILIGLGDTALPRPLTHDLLMNLLPHTGLDILRVEIVDIRENTFYAQLLFTGREYTEKQPLILDARPSDALALAVRRNCPILVAEKVIRHAGVPITIIMETALGEMSAAKGGQQFSPSAPTNPQREALLAELDGAVAAEEYERAAEIRDMLILMDKEKQGT